jgi:hypothetical protein
MSNKDSNLAEVFEESSAAPEESAEAHYNPSHLWKKTTQPTKGLTVEGYCALAEAASSAFSQQITNHLQKNNLSYVAISHADFLDYEQSTQRFKPWFEKYCAARGLNPIVDICIVGPCVKTIESAGRKMTYGSQEQIEGNLDYLRAMPIVMRPPISRAKEQGLATLQRYMRAAEYSDNGQQRPRKNCLHTPHQDTGHISHKTAWRINIPEGDMKGLQIDGELKITHVDIMDVDWLTRKFLDMQRGALSAAERLAPYPNAAAKMQNYAHTAQKWSKILYNRAAWDAGMERFLASDDLRIANRPAPHMQIYRELKADLKLIGCNNSQRDAIIQRVIDSGAFDPILPVIKGQKTVVSIRPEIAISL